MALLFGALQLLSVVRPQIAGNAGSTKSWCINYQQLQHAVAPAKMPQMQKALVETNASERPGRKRVEAACSLAAVMRAYVHVGRGRA